jgi:hypothetical protein
MQDGHGRASSFFGAKFKAVPHSFQSHLSRNRVPLGLLVGDAVECVLVKQQFIRQGMQRAAPGNELPRAANANQMQIMTRN